MNKRNNDIIIAGKRFSPYVYNFLMNGFKEAFSHSSLTIEQAFYDLEYYKLLIETSYDKVSADYYKLLSPSRKNHIREIVHQIIVFLGSKVCAFPEKLDGTQKQIDEIYNKYFNYFNDYVIGYLKFNEEGLFDKIATFHNMENLFSNLPKYKNCYDKAVNTKRDNLEAFDYALSLDNITVDDTIRINEIVNQHDLDKVDGFKKTNNDILNANFTPVDKENVPLEMKRLFKEYEEGFGLEILDPGEANISYKERLNRLNNIFKREAIFHIRFIRIHPFNDGNGRTGRIILNQHLLKQHIAPVIITDVLSEDYRSFINNYQVDSLTKLLWNSSSQQLTNWISLDKAHSYGSREDSVKNEKFSELSDFDKPKQNKRKK